MILFKSSETTRTFALGVITFISLFLCQILKFIVFSVKEKKPMWRTLYTTGGMPSSHTSSMVTLTFALFLIQLYFEGKMGYEVAVAFALTCVVMYDACNVRNEAGKHAKILNEILEDEDIDEADKIKEKVNKGKNLKELIGHKPLEVLGGLIFGLIAGGIGAIIYIYGVGI